MKIINNALFFLIKTNFNQYLKFSKLFPTTTIDKFEINNLNKITQNALVQYNFDVINYLKSKGRIPHKLFFSPQHFNNFFNILNFENYKNILLFVINKDIVAQEDLPQLIISWNSVDNKLYEECKKNLKFFKLYDINRKCLVFFLENFNIEELFNKKLLNNNTILHNLFLYHTVEIFNNQNQNYQNYSFFIDKVLEYNINLTQKNNDGNNILHCLAMGLTKTAHYTISFESLLPILNHKNFNISLLIEKNNLGFSFIDLIKKMPTENNQNIILQDKLNKFILNATIKEAVVTKKIKI